MTDTDVDIESIFMLDAPESHPCGRLKRPCSNEAVWVIVFERPYCDCAPQELCDPCMIETQEYFASYPHFACRCQARIYFVGYERIPR